MSGSQETARARQAWADYLALGPDRSLEKLFRLYQNRATSAPTAKLETLKLWSRHHGWQARLQAIADREVQAAEAQQRAYIASIMETGFATTHERVQALKHLAGILQDELTTAEKGKKNRLWVKEPKGIGQGENFELVTVERFNHHEVDQYRGVLDDIAKELGARPRRTELTGAGGGPLRVARTVEELTDDDLAAIAARGYLTGDGGDGTVAETAGSARA